MKYLVLIAVFYAGAFSGVLVVSLCRAAAKGNKENEYVIGNERVWARGHDADGNDASSDLWGE